MEERAQYNPGKINKAEFLSAIQGPFEKAFTPENIKKGFKKTGTWPIDHNQITAEMIGPSEGISGKSTPIINLNSPVKNTIQLLDIALAAHSQSQVTGDPSHCPSPASQNSSLADDLAPPPSPLAINSPLLGFEGTRAAFLFDGLPPSSANALPVIDYHLPDPPMLSDTSSQPLKEAQLMALTKTVLVDQVLKMQHDIELLVKYSEATAKTACSLSAQLALLAMENKTLRTGLFLKEERKKKPRDVLFPNGRGQAMTEPPFMDRHAVLEAERMQKKAEKAKKAADLVARRAIWEIQKTEHEKRKQDFAARGLAMAKAGPPPLLRDVVLGDEMSQSAVPSPSAETIQNSQKGKGRQRRISIDSLIGEAIEYDEAESEEESGFWSAHDKSDE